MDSTDDSPRIVVLGAGLAGLVVAREAARAGADVTVLESHSRPGGMARCAHHGDITADLGPHRVYSTMPEMRQWFRDTLGERLFVVKRHSRMFVRGRYIHYPPSPIDMLRAFGPVDFTRFTIAWAAARARGLAGAQPEDSFADVMRHTYGSGLCEEMVFPYIRKLWRCEPDQISADAARARATMGGVGRLLRRWLGHQEQEGQETSLKTFEYIRGGIETLVDLLADQVREAGGRIICDAPATRVTCEGAHATRVEYQGGEAPCDFVFATNPLDELVHATQGAPAIDHAARQAADALEYLDVLLVYLVVNKPQISPDTWFYYPQAKPNLNRAYQPKNFDQTLVPPDRSVICLEATAPPGDPLWDRDKADLIQDFTNRIASTQLIAPDEVADGFVRRVTHAYPIYNREYRPHRQALLNAMRGVDNLIPLGRQGLFQHNNMDHTIWTALRAIECWRREADPVATWHEREIPDFDNFRIVD